MPTLIAGSTWPADEAHLLPALSRLLRERNGVRVVLVPHEPIPAHVDPLRRWASGTGLSFRVMSEGRNAGTPRIVILDAVGVLAEGYRHAQIVYVGGAFSTGVHSVIEPAIAGVPVLFGPRHDNSFEALQLIERGAASVVRSADDIYATILRYLDDASLRARAGGAGRSYVESQLGATEKCMAAMQPWL